MSQSSNNSENQEIDLSLISKKIGNFFEDIASLIFRGILFLKRNILTIGILFILGLGVGFYLDKTTNSYEHEIIVTPNFGSNDYLYSKVSLLNSKISEHDTVFLLNAGFKNLDAVGKIQIKPIVDIYKFVDGHETNFDLIKLMAEDGDINKIVTDNMTSKNYPFHSLVIGTSGKITNKDLIEPLLNYLNDSDYYKALQKQYLSNVDVKMIENDTLIKQINKILNDFNSVSKAAAKGSNLVYYNNENSQLNDIIKSKEGLISEQGSHRLDKINMDKIIKDVSIVTNIKNVRSVNGKLKFLFPLAFIFIFFAVTFFIAFYKRQSAKLNA